MSSRSGTRALITRLVPGERLSRYLVGTPIARGGMSEVYRATDEELGRSVALKVLDPFLAESPGFKERFERESQLAASLDHPNVIPIYEAGEHDGLLFIAMRLVEGIDLASLVDQQGALPLPRMTSIIEQTASALDAAHSKGLIHRDVKPANILLSSAVEQDGITDHVYLSDFGLTKSMSSDSRLTETGQMIGSVQYMPPEQIEGKEVDHRADIYSLGCVLYECLTGEPPFTGESDVAVLWAHVQAETPSVCEKRSDLPEPVDLVVGASLAKHPTHRFESCGKMSKALQAALRGKTPSLPRAKPIWRRRVTEADFKTPDSLGVRLRRGLATIAVIGLAVMGMVGVGRVTGLIASSGGGPTSLPPSATQEGSFSDADADDSTSAATKSRQRKQIAASTTDRRASSGPSAASEEEIFGSSLGGGEGNGPGPVAERAANNDPRRLIEEYTGFATDDLAGRCVASDACLTFAARRGERSIEVSVKDRLPGRVRAWVQQDTDGDGSPNGDWKEICGSTDERWPIAPGALVRVFIQQPKDCNGGINPSSGTITVTFHREAA